MLIFHGGSDIAPEMKSPEAMQKHMQKWFAWIEKLSKEGRYEGGEALLPSGKFIGGKNKAKIIGNNPNLTDLDKGDLKYEIDFRSVYASLLNEKLNFDYHKIGIQNKPLHGLF